MTLSKTLASIAHFVNPYGKSLVGKALSGRSHKISRSRLRIFRATAQRMTSSTSSPYPAVLSDVFCRAVQYRGASTNVNSPTVAFQFPSSCLSSRPYHTRLEKFGTKHFCSLVCLEAEGPVATDVFCTSLLQKGSVLMGRSRRCWTEETSCKEVFCPVNAMMCVM